MAVQNYRSSERGMGRYVLIATSCQIFSFQHDLVAHFKSPQNEVAHRALHRLYVIICKNYPFF